MKYIDGTYGYLVADEAAKYADNIDGAIFVQIDENVVDYDKNSNERSIDVTNTVVSHVVRDMRQVAVLSWIYWNGDEQGGGGFNWVPVEENTTLHDTVQDEANNWRGDHPAIVRFFSSVEVPDFGDDEAGRARTTAWLDGDIEKFEGAGYEADEVRLVYVNDEQGRVLMGHLVHLRLQGHECTADESAAIKEYLRIYGPEDEHGVAQDLVKLFPLEGNEVLDEVMSPYTCTYCGEVPADTGYDRCFNCRTWRDEEWCEAKGHEHGVPLTVQEVREVHRSTMRRYMHNAHQEIAGLLHYWHTNDLPGAFLFGPEYPFDQSLEEVESRVGQAALVLGQPLVVADPIMRIWDGMSDDEIDAAVKAAEKIDGLGRWHYAGQQPGAACGAGEDKLTTGDVDRVTCTACKRLIAEDEGGEFQGELARFTPMLNLLLKDNDHDAEMWENGNLLGLVLDAQQGTALGIADYVDEHWNVTLYHQRDNFHFEFADVDTDENYMDVTASIGKVAASDDPDTQVELARRILHYLKSEQHKIDVATLIAKMEDTHE